MGNPTNNTAIKGFLDSALNKCMDVVDASSGSIFLIDKKRKELVLEVCRNLRGIRLEGLKQKIGEGIAGRVASRKLPLLVEDINSNPIFAERPNLNRYQSRSFVSVPLEYSGDLLGVVSVTDRLSGASFNNEDLKIVLGVCQNLGIALYSLMRYVREQNKVNYELKDEIKELKISLAKSRKFSSLGRLAGGFAHELNNPLDGIIRYINLALDNIESESIAREYILESKQGLNRLVKIVRSLLAFSWNLSDSHNFIDINRAIDECVFSAKKQLDSYGIKIEKDYSYGLPQIPDYGFKMVINNLISNASAAMNKTGGKISISTRKNPRNVNIIFSDTGPGVSEDIQNKIFDPFFTTKSIGEGSGLGLAICNEIIQRYSGKINLESKLKRGAAFIIKLPIRR